tara:strand:+ start:251 stop:556 length:306 start_codon:yes stop_codon:yes gene_type:complete
VDYPAVLVETWAVVFLPVIPHLLVWAIEQAVLVTKDRLDPVEEKVALACLVVAVVWTYPVVVGLHQFPVSIYPPIGCRKLVEAVLWEELPLVPHQLIRHQR